MAWWEYAKPGDKVVCVKDSTKRSETTLNLWQWFRRPDLKVGRIYTIRRIYPSQLMASNIAIDIGKNYGSDKHYAYCAYLFRPVEDSKRSTKTGMSILRGLLKGNPVKEEERV